MKFARTFLLAVLVLASAIGHSAEDNSKEPIYIESDTATYDENTGQSVYVGDVQVTQGNLHMNSDRLVVYSASTNKNKINKFIATGNPVRMKQTPGDGKDEIRGESLRAEYYISASKLLLLDEAEVWQGKSAHTTSERIEYDTKNSIVKAGDKNSGSKRVHVTLHPE